MYQYPRTTVIRIKGYDAYFSEAQPELENILKLTVNDPDGHLQIAIMEAVFNAARYAKVGYELAEITITAKVFETDVKISIESDSREFDVEALRRKIKSIACDKHWTGKDFGEYTGHDPSGRGFWLMLMACEFLYLDYSGKKVTLCTSYPFDPQLISRNVNILASRLYLEKDGVIY